VLRNPGLEQAIRERPDDVEPFLVYADWLAQQGDARGELIVVQHALDDARLPREEVTRLRGRERELMRLVWPSLRPAIEAELLRAADWRWGFVDRLHLCRSSHVEEGPPDLLPVARALLESPPLAVVRSLALGLLHPTDNTGAVEELLAFAGSAPVGAGLRALAIGELDGRIGDLGPEWQPGPLGDVSAPLAPFVRLETLTIRGAGARADGRLELPSLNLLLLEAEEGLESILAALEAPRLRVLALRATADTDLLVARLAMMPFASTLERLDLGESALTDAGARTVAELAARWRRLVWVDVTRNRLTADGLAALHRAGVSTVGDRSQRPITDENDDEEPDDE